jgi:lipopolysaccharide biosynthesis glycosyltransferase
MELPSLVSSLPSSTLSGIDEITLTLFYHNHGYTWHHISMSYDVAAYHQYAIFRADEAKERTRSTTIHALHYITPYKPWVETRE